MGVVSSNWFDRVFALNSLHVQILALTDAQTPFLGTPLSSPQSLWLELLGLTASSAPPDPGIAFGNLERTGVLASSASAQAWVPGNMPVSAHAMRYRLRSSKRLVTKRFSRLSSHFYWVVDLLGGHVQYPSGHGLSSEGVSGTSVPCVCEKRCI